MAAHSATQVCKTRQTNDVHSLCSSPNSSDCVLPCLSKPYFLLFIQSKISVCLIMLQGETTTQTLVKSSTSLTAEPLQSSRIASWLFCAWRHHCGGWHRDLCDTVREDAMLSTIFIRFQDYETSVWHKDSTEVFTSVVFVAFLTGRLKLWFQDWIGRRRLQTSIDSTQLCVLSTSVWLSDICFGNWTRKKWYQKVTFMPEL